MVVQLPDINKKFYDIINQEDWDITLEDVDPNIQNLHKNFITQSDVPLGQMFLPTPLPGVWISLFLGFDIENPEEDIW